MGAGPAGAFAAYELARVGVRVLLIDRQRFPRGKVCGGCLNARTVGLLEASGLGQLPASLGGEPLDRFELWTRGRTVRLPMPPGIAISRYAFDEALIAAAMAAGAEFLPETPAVLGALASKVRLIRLPRAKYEVSARSVIAADGLGGSFLPSESGYRAHPVPESRIGAGAVLDDPQDTYPSGVIHMAVTSSGYAGATKVEGGRLCVAAALDRKALDEGRSLAETVAAILTDSGLPGLPGLPGAGAEPPDPGTVDAHWRGTAALSRSAPSVAFERVFLVGDAAGYVEPFTGEGISWALEAAHEVSSLAAAVPDGKRPASESSESRWRRRYSRRIVRRQRWCRSVSWALRRPALVASAALLLGAAPNLARPLMTHLNRTPGRTMP